MKFIAKNLLLLIIVIALTSCSTDEDQTIESVQLKEASSKNSQKSLFENSINPEEIIWKKSGIVFEDYNGGSLLFNFAESADCIPSSRWEALLKHNELLTSSFLSNWDENLSAYNLIFKNYFLINQYAALDKNKNADYFGDQGQYTNLVRQQTRKLEKFWNMPDMVKVRGQHVETLEDLDFIRSVFEDYSSASAETIDYLVEIAEYYNNASDQIPENPYFALDGLSTFDGYIVIGDGIISIYEEIGLDPKIVWSCILAHEWSHQIQFLNFGSFEYPIPPFIETPESKRMIELEADFNTGYFLTHKRGGAYNWKRVEEFQSVFFEAGDCLVDKVNHHGTSIQRMEASRQGYLLALSEKKKGKISGTEEVHQAFLNKLDMILYGEE